MTNNYVWYSGRMWRVFKKDTVGLMMMTNEAMTSIAFGSGAANSNQFSTSYANEWLNNVFLPTLNNYTDTNFIKTFNFDTTTYNGTSLGTPATTSSRIGLVSVADYLSLTNNTALAGGGYCTDGVSYATLKKYKNQSDCEATGYCSDGMSGENLPAYQNQSDCSHSGYCSDPQYNDSASCEAQYCHNNNDWIIMPQYTNDPTGCSNNNGTLSQDNYWQPNYWTPTNYWNPIIGYYLRDGTHYKTLTPKYSSTTNTFVINETDTPGFYIASYNTGLRPVIVIDSNTTITSGNGTASNPYKLTVDKQEQDSKLLSDKSVGEYINYSGYTWRIQDKTSNIRLIMNGTLGNRAFDPDNTQVFNPSDANNIGYYLNNDFYNTLDKSKIVDSTFALGKCCTAADYKRAYVDKTYADVTAKVGLPRIGEMFAASNVVDNSYTLIQQSYWSITPSSSIASYVYYTNSQNVSGTKSAYDAANYLIRPVITVDSSATITGGKGTLGDPYNIK